jgi:nucleotide-binding universal stress UspA family protein
MSEVARKFQRILLPLDVSRDSLTALEIAFGLAAALGCEISGLFIEDAELLMAGSLPFAREVGSLSGISRQIGSLDIEHRFRAVAGKAREVLAEAGRRQNVPSSFRVTRGDVPAEILTAATDADLVALGKAGWSVGAFRRPGSTCLAILTRSRIPVLIVERGATLSRSILAVHDDTAAGQRALDFAGELSRRLSWDISFLAVRELSTGEEALESIHQEKSHLIVLPSSVPLSEYALQLKCPVVFVP